jgi:hypothetical protein
MNPLLQILTLVLCTLIASCNGPLSTTNTASNENFNQGLAGKVLWREGDFMPGPDNKNKSVGVAREIYIHKVTNLSQATQTGQFFTDIKTDLIKKVNSDETGNFFTSISPGTYSLFTKEGDAYFANIFDGDNNICPVIVDSGRVTKVSIVVDYKAAY